MESNRGLYLEEGASRWAALPHKDWPEDEEQQKVILSDFDLSSKYGDRRQEIVFIGANMDEVSGRYFHRTCSMALDALVSLPLTRNRLLTGSWCF